MTLSPEVLAELDALLAEAAASGDPEPTAMNLSTVDATGRPHSRIVLLKGTGPDGLRFFTNHTSAKGQEIATNSLVALCLHWKHLREGVQVRIEGEVEELPAKDSDAYFATRPRGSQIGAWASRQSERIATRGDLERRVAVETARFAGQPVPRPDFWSGFRVVPDRIEFWIARPGRLHERELFERHDDGWRVSVLYP